MRIRIAFVVLFFVTVSGCSKVFLQDDGFGEKVRAGCKTEDQCRRLQLEAEQRTITCKDNVVGYVRCDEARADKLMADAYVRKYDESKQRHAEDARQAEIDRRRLEAERAHEARVREHENA